MKPKQNHEIFQGWCVVWSGYPQIETLRYTRRDSKAAALKRHSLGRLASPEDFKNNTLSIEKVTLKRGWIE